MAAGAELEAPNLYLETTLHSSVHDNGQTIRSPL